MDNDILEDAIIESVRKDPILIKSIEVKSDKIYLAALSQDVFMYRYISDPSPKIITYVYKKDPNILTNPADIERWIKLVKIDPRYLWFSPQSNRVYISAAAVHDNVFEFIHNADENLHKLIVSINPRNISCIPNPSQEVINIAMIISEGRIINLLPENERTISRCSQAVTLNPYNLHKLKESDVYPWQLCELIRSEPDHIKWLENPSEKLQLIAVRSDPESYLHIESPTFLVTHEAFSRRSELSLADAKTQTYDLCELCIRRNPCDIKFVNDDLWTEKLTLSVIPHLHIDYIPDKFMTPTCAMEYAKIRPLDLVNTIYAKYAIEVCPELIVHANTPTCKQWMRAVALRPYLYTIMPKEFRSKIPNPYN